MPLLMSSTFAPDGERRLPVVHARTTTRTSRRSRATPSTTPTPTSSTRTTSRWSARPSSRCWTWCRRTSSATTPRSSSRWPRLGSRFRKLDKRVLHNAVRLLTGSAADFLDDYFESEILKGYLASSSIIGTKVGPRSQGSGLVLLYHTLGEHDGEFGAWAFHKGGNGGFTQVLARAAAVVRGRDHPRIAGRARSSRRTAGRPASRSTDGTEYYAERRRLARSTRGARSSSSSSRASCRPTSSRTSSGSGSRAPRRR